MHSGRPRSGAAPGPTSGEASRWHQPDAGRTPIPLFSTGPAVARVLAFASAVSEPRGTAHRRTCFSLRTPCRRGSRDRLVHHGVGASRPAVLYGSGADVRVRLLSRQPSSGPRDASLTSENTRIRRSRTAGNLVWTFRRGGRGPERKRFPHGGRKLTGALQERERARSWTMRPRTIVRTQRPGRPSTSSNAATSAC